jgi:hypothetical protein
VSKVQATEITYELHTLGWKAFQKLCSTIIADIWGQTIQTFFDSNDGGRDGAFHGNWTNQNSYTFEGSFTVQCKFTATPDKTLKLSDLNDELVKAERIASKGLAKNYFIFTNAKLTGRNEEKIRKKFETIPGLENCITYGKERICELIHESKRLRMLVPRIYGLGDLGQILDERAYSQAQEILSSLGGDLNKFIITEAYRKSAKAIVKHGFVLLLGEPMCGKSTIAAALAMGALDEWGCSTIKARDADDFVKHFNPHEKQLFWVDDVFGATQFDLNSTSNWNRSFAHINALIHRNKGSKVIFTSRDYIYEAARNHLKESIFPIIKESQVVIRVENLSQEEKEQILYNHIRLGKQPKSYKKKLKPYLPDIASNPQFSPEIARRLGNPLFTKYLDINKDELKQFIEHPLEMLCEIINTLDDGSQAALTLVFLRGGNLSSPLQVTNEEKQAIEKLGGTVGSVTKSLKTLNGSLLMNVIENGENVWRFKHPSIQDALAAIVASNPDLLDIYLTGAPIEKLFREISCGDVGLKGASVIVPQSLYPIVTEKIKKSAPKKWNNKAPLYRFLSYRCDKIFLAHFIKEFPNFISELYVGSYLEACPDVDVFIRLAEFNLLPEEERSRFVSTVKELAVETPDSDFLRGRISNLITSTEMTDILTHVETSLLPNLDETVNEWEENYDAEESPESYFHNLTSALNRYQKAFEDNEVATIQIREAIECIDKVIQSLLPAYEPSVEQDFFDNVEDDLQPLQNTRSIFDDVDS